MRTDMQSSTSPVFAGRALKQVGSFSLSSLSGNSVLAVAGLCGGCGPGGTVAPHLDVGIVNANGGAASPSPGAEKKRGGAPPLSPPGEATPRPHHAPPTIS